MIAATQIRVGMILELDKKLCRVMNVTHITPGNKRGIIQTQLRNLLSGNQEERRFGSDEKVERAILEQHEMEFLYADGEHYHFMHTENYEQVTFGADLIGDGKSYLLPNLKVVAEFYDGRPVSVVLPPSIALTVTEAEPTVRFATAAASYKQATLETGLNVKVPNFIQVGEKVKIDTSTGDYIERA
ncbi:MAG: elongation factor P [Deltaproteobacteria bacterium]|nr:elongation factor P [Deltaproteobacteria bacterium]